MKEKTYELAELVIDPSQWTKHEYKGSDTAYRHKLALIGSSGATLTTTVKLHGLISCGIFVPPESMPPCTPVHRQLALMPIRREIVALLEYLPPENPRDDWCPCWKGRAG